MHILRKIRLDKQMPIAALAVSGKVGTGTIVMIERHGHIPRIDTQLKIARAVGVDVKQLWPSSDQSGLPPTAA